MKTPFWQKIYVQPTFNVSLLTFFFKILIFSIKIPFWIQDCQCNLRHLKPTVCHKTYRVCKVTRTVAEKSGKEIFGLSHHPENKYRALPQQYPVPPQPQHISGRFFFLSRTPRRVSNAVSNSVGDSALSCDWLLCLSRGT